MGLGYTVRSVLNYPVSGTVRGLDYPLSITPFPTVYLGLLSSKCEEVTKII